MTQLEDNLRAADLQLTQEEIERLSETTKPPQLYPEWMIERQNAGRTDSVSITPISKVSVSAPLRYNSKAEAQRY
jgi:hypothetical protein